MSETSNTSLNHQLSQYFFRSILSTVGASIYVLADSFFGRSWLMPKYYSSFVSQKKGNQD